MHSLHFIPHGQQLELKPKTKRRQWKGKNQKISSIIHLKVQIIRWYNIPLRKFRIMCNSSKCLLLKIGHEIYKKDQNRLEGAINKKESWKSPCSWQSHGLILFYFTLFFFLFLGRKQALFKSKARKKEKKNHKRQGEK